MRRRALLLAACLAATAPLAAARADEAGAPAVDAPPRTDGGAGAAPQAAPPDPRTRAFLERLDAAEALYLDGEYEDALSKLEALLARPRRVAEAARARAHRLLGETLVALGRRGEALEAFRRMLALTPDAELDPVTTSPKILEVFRQARAAIPDAGP